MPLVLVTNDGDHDDRCGDVEQDMVPPKAKRNRRGQIILEHSIVKAGGPGKASLSLELNLYAPKL